MHSVSQQELKPKGTAVEKERQGDPLTPEKLERYKKNLIRHYEKVLSRIGQIEERILTTPEINVNVLIADYKEIENLSKIYNHLKQMEYNRFILPALQAEQELKEKSKIITE